MATAQKKEGKMISQCPKCLAVYIRYDGDRFGPRRQETVVVFNNVLKEVCPNCK